MRDAPASAARSAESALEASDGTGFAMHEKGPACGAFEILERTTGLEPATPTLARLCSTN